MLDRIKKTPSYVFVEIAVCLGALGAFMGCIKLGLVLAQ
jgi:hypothetical protein